MKILASKTTNLHSGWRILTPFSSETIDSVIQTKDETLIVTRNNYVLEFDKDELLTLRSTL